MTNKEIAEFINSNDMRNYLLEINYDFNSLEAAWIVDHDVNHTLKEKISAWQNIINTMPDYYLTRKEGLHFDNELWKDGTHSFLKNYIEVIKYYLGKFFENENQVIYTVIMNYKFEDNGSVQSYYNDNNELDYHRMPFSTYDKVKDYIKNEGYADEDTDVERIYINKRWIDSKKCIRLEFSIDNLTEPLSIDICDEDKRADYLNYEGFEALFLLLPTPFKKGDLCCVAEHCKTCYNSDKYPFVIEGTSWDSFIKDGRYHCDGSDMNFYGYFEADKCHFFYEVSWNYMDVEYYKKEPVGWHRVMKALSALEKGEIEVELFRYAMDRIQAEENEKECRKVNCFTKEGLAKAGIE